MNIMRYYVIRIQVDFETPREMPPLKGSQKPWHSVGYFQNFYCTEKTKEKAKQLAYDHFRNNDAHPKDCSFRFEDSVWLRGITRREQLSPGLSELTEEMFEKRNEIGIWAAGGKEYYVSEEDYAASLCEEVLNDDL